ncbi:MAG: carboxymuconolactone decarboxylase family protein [Dehalococcoidia bacterium]
MARSEGLEEEQVELIADGYDQASLSERDKATLTLTDAIIGDPRSLTAAQRVQIRAQMGEPEIVEVALGVGLFMGLSKVLITLGLEPDVMETTIVPTPGSR